VQEVVGVRLLFNASWPTEFFHSCHSERRIARPRRVRTRLLAGHGKRKA
jgi:hypothetical protein